MQAFLDKYGLRGAWVIGIGVGVFFVANAISAGGINLFGWQSGTLKEPWQRWALGVLGAVLTIVCGLLLFQSVAKSPSSGDTPKIAETGLVGGIVRDNRTWEPIGGAKIDFTGLGVSVGTDSTGHFRVELGEKAKGRVVLHVTKEGYEPRDEPVGPPVDGVDIRLSGGK